MVVCGMAYGFQGAAIGTVQKSLVGRRKISDFNQNSALGRNAINDQGNGEHAPALADRQAADEGSRAAVGRHTPHRCLCYPGGRLHRR